MLKSKNAKNCCKNPKTLAKFRECVISLTHFSIVDVSPGEVVRPVHDVEASEWQGKYYSRYDVDSFCFREGSIANGGLKLRKKTLTNLG